ncbi:MAG TPA: C39 family peptidase [Limosilactobacillus oris]|uniref:C39 family peptidase n=1 Tax=Limosilactobacillus oris TaxID=1632 RepID=UPI001D716CEF|nr:C39 family peptidase [Limosilactobacillus oris]HJF47265.1 C39 family peptidase [Limosilactobacillus oris]
MENKRHVKLYKAGKLWCAMALTTVALGAGIALNETQASADSNVMESSATVTNTAPAEKQLSAIETSEVQPAPDSTTTPAQETSVDPNDHGNYAWLDQQQINSQGQLVATGWHATNESAGRNYHYIIAYDQTNHTEIGRQLVGDTAQQIDRSDVAKVHHVAGAGQSGFRVTFDLGKTITNTQSIQLISRYSSDKSGNQGYIDYWFAPITVNRDNNASLDNAVVVDGKLQLTGWHASNLAADKGNHFIIIYDQTLGRELTRQKVDSVSRPDVAKIYSDVENAGHSGFNVSFNLAGLDFNHQLQVISRYSSSADGNSDYLDYWFAPITTGNYANQGCLDVLNLSNAKQVTVSGWHANDISRFATNHFLILYDDTANRQVAVITAKNGQRPDVARVFPAITTAGKSGFTGSFDLSNVQLVGGHTYSVVSRYSTSDQGNGGTGSCADYWFAPVTLDQHAFFLDRVKMTDQGLQVNGWMVSDYAGNHPYAYAIVMNNGKEVARQQLTLTARPDVARAYSNIYDSRNSGFSELIKLNPADINGSMQVILRFSNDRDGNGNYDDQWSQNYASNQGWFDQTNFDGQQVHVAGWHASNQSAKYQYHWLIAVDQAGHELGRWQVQNKQLERADVGKKLSYVLNSDHSGFNLSFAVNNRMQHKVIRLIDRLTDDPNGNGHYVDFTSNSVSINSGAQTIGLKTLYYDAMGNIVGAFNNAEVICQNPELPTGCEMTAVTMMLRYAGVNINKFQVANETPRSSNGDFGFVGNPYSVTGWWVFPTGIAPVVQHHLGTSQVMTGASLAAIQEKLNIGHLVVVWVANMNGFVNHAITLTGYNASGFFYNNPWTGRKEAMSYGEFYGHWNADAQRALSY